MKRFKTSELPRSKNYPIQRELSQLEDDFYSKSFEAVRNSFLTMMADEDLDLETRLYAIANIAHKISSFYHRGCSKPDKGQLKSVLLLLSENEFISKLDSFIKDYDANSSLNMIVVHSILLI